MSGIKEITRRNFIKATGAGLFLAGLHFALPLPAWAFTASPGIKRTTPKSRYDLTIGYSPIRIDGREGTATAINGTVPGPLVHLREGDDVVFNVTNRSDGHGTCLHPLARHPGALPHGRGAGRELRRHPAGRDLRVPLPGQTGRHLLVSQPLAVSGADRHLRPLGHRAERRRTVRPTTATTRWCSPTGPSRTRRRSSVTST